jgi:hypothetical protein
MQAQRLLQALRVASRSALGITARDNANGGTLIAELMHRPSRRDRDPKHLNL